MCQELSYNFCREYAGYMVFTVDQDTTAVLILP